MTPEQALSKAIRLAGGPRAVAEAFDIFPEAVYQWKTAPAKRVLLLEELSGGKVRRWELHPDLYPRPKRKPEARA